MKKIDLTDWALLSERQSSYVYSLGISTPKAGGLVKVIGGSVGAVYQNIPGKKSLIRAISEDWDNMSSYIHRFVELGTVIRSKPCDKERFVPVEERMKNKLSVATMYTYEEKTRISDFLDAIPKCDNCLHGDYHPGNYIFSGNDVYAIDRFGGKTLCFSSKYNGSLKKGLGTDHGG